MVIDELGNVEGSVTGGCVESAVFERAMVFKDGDAPRVARFGISDGVAGEVGLTCGGTVQIFIRELTKGPSGQALRSFDAISGGATIGVATLLDGRSTRRNDGLG